MNDKSHRRTVGQTPFIFHRMDLPQRKEKSGLGVLVAAIGMLACMVGAIGWTLWGSL